MAVTRNGSAIRLVYDSVKKAIFKQRLKPKSALTEQSLCDALGVGHSSVRSALQQLAAEGFVEIIPNKGAFVASFTREQVCQLYDLRIALELYALKQVLPRFNEADCQFLAHSIEQEEEAADASDFERYLELNSGFHYRIIDKLGNMYLSDVFRQLYNKIIVYLVLYDHFYKVGRRGLHSIPNHKKMLAALEAGNYRKVEKLLLDQKEKIAQGFNLDLALGADVGVALRMDG